MSLQELTSSIVLNLNLAKNHSGTSHDCVNAHVGRRTRIVRVDCVNTSRCIDALAYSLTFKAFHCTVNIHTYLT
jgi:hypothetical protein